MMDRLTAFGRGALLIVPLVLCTQSALGRDDGRYTDSPLKPWFDSLRSHITVHTTDDLLDLHQVERRMRFRCQCA